jgi:hypothetical protein
MTKIVEETYQKHQGSIPSSSDKVESEGREMKQCWKKTQKILFEEKQHFFTTIV